MPSTDQLERATGSRRREGGSAGVGVGDERPIPQQRPPYDPTEHDDEPEAEPVPEHTRSSG